MCHILVVRFSLEIREKLAQYQDLIEMLSWDTAQAKHNNAHASIHSEGVAMKSRFIPSFPIVRSTLPTLDEEQKRACAVLKMLEAEKWR